MKGLLYAIALVCIWSTPFQVGLALWALVEVLTTDVTLFSLTNDVFLGHHLAFIHSFVKPFSYVILPDILADFVWSLPIVLHSGLKAITSTLIGIWLMKIVKSM